MFDWLRKIFGGTRSVETHVHLDRLVKQTPAPFFWLFGKTQSGKTSIIKYLTGADAAEIGQGFRPCTRFSREFWFPAPEAPLLTFLDTRGLEEPGYDPKEDLALFNSQAHVVIVTVRVMDQAIEDLIRKLRTVRNAQPRRPVVLALTCLHEAYPQEQHLQPYPFLPDGTVTSADGVKISEDLVRSIAAHRQNFQGLYDHVVPIDFTPREEGFHEPDYGGPVFRQVLLDALPAAYRQTLLKLEEATNSLRDLFERQTLPYILGYSTLAATVGAFPVPWVDLFLLPGIQTQMIHHLARLYGQPLTSERFIEFSSILGVGLLIRQGIRELTKFIPIVGSLASAALAGSSTFALGKAFCFYYGHVRKGHVPSAEELKHYYQEQLTQAKTLWSKS